MIPISILDASTGPGHPRTAARGGALEGVSAWLSDTERILGLAPSARPAKRGASIYAGLVLLAALTGCVDRGADLVNGVQGRLSAGPGVVFIERGPLHDGTFIRAGLIAEDGTFSIGLDDSGTHGFHAYFTDTYLYLPIEVEVEDGVMTTVTQTDVDWEFMCDRGGNCEWVEQSEVIEILTPGQDLDLSDDPVISDPVVRRVGPGAFELELMADDPDGDLSVQVLAYHIASGVGQQMNPPGPVIDGNYPNGLYTLTVFLPEGADDTGPWQFVAADHACSNSPILEVEPQ